jgi:hypothetical protein
LTQEGDTGIIELEVAQESTLDLGNDAPRAVKLIVDYLYFHDYDPRTAIAPVSVSIGEDCKNKESTDCAAEVEQTVERHQSQSGVPDLGDETKADDVSIGETAHSNGTDDFLGIWQCCQEGTKGKEDIQMTEYVAARTRTRTCARACF